MWHNQGFSDWVFGGPDIAGRAGRFLPGPLVLRISRTGGDTAADVTDQTIWLAPSWQTLVIPNTSAGPDARRILVQMAPVNGPPGQARESVSLAVEAALAGLRNGVPSVPKDLMRLLLNSKFSNPMLGLLGTHALLLDPDEDRQLFRIVVANLRDLVGEHPDVVALRALLGAACSVFWPPMLAMSYRRCPLPVDLAGRDVLPARKPCGAGRGLPRMQDPWLQSTANSELVHPPGPNAPGPATARVERPVDTMAEFHDLGPAEQRPLGCRREPYRHAGSLCATRRSPRPDW